MKMTETEYRSHPALSRSDVLLLKNKCPLYLRAYLDGEVERVETPALTFGLALHCYVLEPDDFANRYAVSPKFDKRLKSGKEAYAEFVASVGDRMVIEEGDFDKIQKMSKAIDQHGEARELLDGIHEEAFFAVCEDVAVKCKVDCYNGDYIVDVKTALDASPDGFARAIATHDYHIQAAFYSDILKTNGLPVRSFKFVAIEKTAPYLVGVYEIVPQHVEAGRAVYRSLLKQWKKSVDSGIYEGYGSQILTPPIWKLYESENLSGEK